MQKDEKDFSQFFRAATGFDPYNWQIKVALDGLPEVLPIPTGLGKTEGSVLAWAWRRSRPGSVEPLHLVYCLPMRSLVRQTVERLASCFNRLAEKRPDILKTPVYQLMGGSIDEEWARRPDHLWVLVGTQDQLLSRALNRGYAMDRFQWPVHFGLLNQDCQWIVDEVQLMGPGLWTTAQLDWMRRKRFLLLKPCRTTWMSATIGTKFLETADRRKDGFHVVKAFDPGLDQKQNPELQWRREAKRSVEWFKPASGKKSLPFLRQIAECVGSKHAKGTLTLVVCNTVKTAQEIFKSLAGDTPKILLTSRFRAGDRLEKEQTLIEFDARRRRSADGWIADDPGLICVSTQVVEAGLDISAHRLWSELAPWPSMIQRLGRLNRDGKDNKGRAIVWKFTPEEKRRYEGEDWIGPYRKTALDQASFLLKAFAPISEQKTAVEALAALQTAMPEELAKTLAIPPEPCPRALDVHGLFSTEPDLHGGFTDVSRFVRNADPDADLIVFWRDWQSGAPPTGDALDGPPLDPNTEACPVAVRRLQEFLKAVHEQAWLWNDRAESWERTSARDLKPGMTVMLRGDTGGYIQALGWTGVASDRLNGLPPSGRGRTLKDDWRAEAGYWSSLASHLADARSEAERICDALSIDGPIRAAVVEGAAWHDLGKAHPRWRVAVPKGGPLDQEAVAKFPKVLRVDAARGDAETVRAAVEQRIADTCALSDEIMEDGKSVRLRWALAHDIDANALACIRALPKVRKAARQAFRPGLRHEAASALAMWRRYRDSNEAPYPALAIYLAAAHHGKVRTVLRAITREGGDVFGVGRTPEALRFGGRDWPMDFSIALDGADGDWSENGFAFAGPGWTGLVADLLGPWRGEADAAWTGAVPKDEPRSLGPFALAWLEALVRVADWRASEQPSHPVRPGGGG